MSNQNNELQQIGSKLSVCRQNNNLTQEELAGRLGITPQALSKWERGISLPDTAMLPDIARILKISIDGLLGIKTEHAEKSMYEIQHRIGENLRNSLEPLELLFGEKLVPLFTDQKYIDEVQELRLRLSYEGFLLPVFRIRDELKLAEYEFQIRSYQKVLYAETLQGSEEEPLHYIMEKMEECIHEQYFEILNPDLLKGMVDNLKIRYPVLIEGVIPDKISYHLLTELVRHILCRGISIIWLPKIIERLALTLEWQQTISMQELEEEIVKGI